MPFDDSHTRRFNKAAGDGDGIDSFLDANGRTLVHAYVEKGDITTVEKLLKMRIDLNRQDNNGQTSLYAAIQRNDLEMVKLLLKHGASFQISDKAGRTPLMWAVEKKCAVEFLEQLQNLGCGFAHQGKNGGSALHTAALCNLPDMVDYFIRNGLSPDIADNEGKTPLHLAAGAKAHEAMRRLLANKANPLLRTNKIETPLHFAAAGGDETATDILLSEPGVKETINSFKTYTDGFSPFLSAVNAGQTKIAEKLIRIGADMSLLDNQDRNALFIAVHAGHLEITKLLIENGADVGKTPYSSRNKTPIIHGVLSSDHCRELLSIFNAAGANLNAPDEYGQTLLHKAVTQGNSKKVAEILSFGVHPDISDKTGARPIDIVTNWCDTNSFDTLKALLDHGARPAMSTAAGAIDSPLHKAVQRGYKNVVQLLLSYNAPVDETERGWRGSTAFLIAAEYGYQDIAQMLLQNGANPLKKDNSGRTALHLATMRRTRAALKGLLAVPGLKAHLNTGDDTGQTPLHYAVRTGNTDAIYFLKEAGADLSVADTRGLTPLHYAAAANDVFTLLFLSTLPGSKIDWDIRSVGLGETPLHLVSRLGAGEMAGHLLTFGASFSSKDKEGMTPLLRAVSENNPSVFNFLINYMKQEKIHPDQHRDNNGWAAIHHAAKHFSSDAIHLLLEAGADINLRTKNGETPLHIAVRTGGNTAVEALLAKGADVFLQDAEGKTPMEIALNIAKEKNNMLIINSLIEHIQKKEKNNDGKKPPPGRIKPPQP